MALSIPNTFANGNIIDAAAINANFTAVATYLDTTKLTATANLSTPYAMFPLTVTHTGDLTGGADTKFYFVVPPTMTIYPVSGHVAFEAVAAGAPTVTMQATVVSPAGTILTSPCSASTAATPDEKTTITTTSVAAGATIVVTLTNTSGGGNTATNVSGTLWCKAVLRS